MNFEEKVKSMTAKEIIMAMVDSLTHPPIINIDMGTFGETQIVDKKFLGIKIGKKKVCFGCAATNTICQISGKKFTIDNIYNRGVRAKFIDSDYVFLSDFETAIDHLRCGNITSYNIMAKSGGFALIKDNGKYFTRLTSNYTNKDLEQYIRLANAQI